MKIYKGKESIKIIFQNRKNGNRSHNNKSNDKIF